MTIWDIIFVLIFAVVIPMQIPLDWESQTVLYAQVAKCLLCFIGIVFLVNKFTDQKGSKIAGVLLLIITVILAIVFGLYKNFLVM